MANQSFASLSSFGVFQVIRETFRMEAVDFILSQLMHRICFPTFMKWKLLFWNRDDQKDA
jgi:hypothetical protein